MLAGGVLSRAVGLVSTLAVVRFVSPTEYGEAIAASIVVGTASQFSSLGIGQFVIVKAGGHRDLAFHATVFQLLLGLLAIGLLMLAPDRMSAWFNAPGMARYVPALALSMLIDRVSFVPERTLKRDMRFRGVTLARSAGELTYSGVAVAAAIAGWGGMAIAVGNVARSLVRAAVMIPAVKRRDWLEPCRLRLDATLAVFRFGVPLSVGAFAGFIASKWDNLLVSRFFGPAVMAEYNLAYNLAGMAPGLVSEQVIDILVPTLSKTDAQRRPQALVRGVRLVALVATPLCFGLAAVSPTLVSTIFNARWAGVAPLLAILSAVTALAPMVGISFAYLQVADRPKKVMILQVLAAVWLLSAVGALGRLGPLWTCAGVGLAALVCFLVSISFTCAVDKMPPSRLLLAHVGPLLASAPMVGAVVGVRSLMTRGGFEVRYANLAIEVVVGMLAYIAAAMLLARPSSRDLIGLVHSAFLRRRRPLATDPS